jgi:hypothetical protein
LRLITDVDFEGDGSNRDDQNADETAPGDPMHITTSSLDSTGNVLLRMKDALSHELTTANPLSYQALDRDSTFEPDVIINLDEEKTQSVSTPEEMINIPSSDVVCDL